MNLAHKRHFDSCLMFTLKDLTDVSWRCALQQNLSLDNPTAGSGSTDAAWPLGQSCGPGWNLRSTLPHGPPRLSPQAENSRVTSLVSLPWLQCKANVFLYGRTLSSTGKSVGMVLSSLVRGEISACWKRRNVLLALWWARGTPEP